ncbi:MAG TPA: nucleotidyl transferase AbiEii/AbiGii toxin family protein [Elusimicrobiales bacterium]|nr:nucleotidyl transferase AbiEii/AbiGii toxin family protein [Elusimicrobiales bacterium]
MKNPFQEQAFFMLRILPQVAAEDRFALKGGTAINFFLRDLPRLSVDIDLTYLPVEPRKETLQGIAEALNRIRTRISRAAPGATIHEGRYEGMLSKLFVRNSANEVKIEPNLVIRGAVQPARERTLSPKTIERFGMSVDMKTLSDADLYGGKICAALDRQHPRDLFDVKVLLENEGITPEIRKAFIVYLISHDRPMHEVLNPTRKKDVRVAFNSDFQGMTDEPVGYQALSDAREDLIAAVNRGLTSGEKGFLLSLKEGEPDWKLLGLTNVEDLPAVRWKLQNIRKMDKAKQRDYARRLKKVLGI